MDRKRLAFSPSADSLRTIDSCSDEIFPETAELRAWHNSYMMSHKLRIALDLDIVKEHTQPKSRLLEIGSIPLLLTSALQKCGYKVTGCDLAPERYASSIEKIGIDVVKCDIETAILPFPDNTFDAVVCNEIFEHLRINPIFTLSEVLRVLKPSAPLLLSSPNLRSLKGLSNFLFRNKAYSCSGDIYAEYQKLSKLGHMGHVREYTTREVIEFLENIGFIVAKTIFRGQYRGNIPCFIITVVPGLSPFVSYVAIKPDRNGK